MNAVLEYNDRGCMLFSADCPGAFARGRDRREAMAKLPGDVASFCRWADWPRPQSPLVKITQEVYQPETAVEDADGNVLFDTERSPLTAEEYAPLRALVLKSARCLDQLYEAIPDPDAPLAPERATFYGRYPNTARSMFNHVNGCTGYYVAGLGAVSYTHLDVYKRQVQSSPSSASWTGMDRNSGSLSRAWSPSSRVS